MSILGTVTSRETVNDSGFEIPYNCFRRAVTITASVAVPIGARSVEILDVLRNKAATASFERSSTVLAIQGIQ